MKRLKAPSASPVSENLAIATSHLANYFEFSKIHEKKEQLNFAKAAMRTGTLPECFSLFIRSIFSHVYTENEPQFNNWLEVIMKENVGIRETCMNLHHHASRQLQTIATQMEESEQLKKLKSEQKQLFRQSHPNLAVAFQRDEELQTQIRQVETEMKQEGLQSILEVFLIVEKILLILPELMKLNMVAVRAFKQSMFEHPASITGKLIPILLLLQRGQPQDLRLVIQMTLKLVKIKDISKVEMIETILVQRGYVAVTGDAVKDTNSTGQPAAAAINDSVSEKEFEASNPHRMFKPAPPPKQQTPLEKRLGVTIAETIEEEEEEEDRLQNDSLLL